MNSFMTSPSPSRSVLPHMPHRGRINTASVTAQQWYSISIEQQASRESKLSGSDNESGLTTNFTVCHTYAVSSKVLYHLCLQKLSSHLSVP